MKTDRTLLRAALLAVLAFAIVPAGIGWAWETWQAHERRECDENYACRKEREAADKAVVDDEMPSEANYNYYRGE